MKTEKIVKREDGRKYKITVELYVERFFGGNRNSFEYQVSVLTKAKNQRIWRSIPDEMSDWEFRKLSLENRRLHRLHNILLHVTPIELNMAERDLWLQLEPKLKNTVSMS